MENKFTTDIFTQKAAEELTSFVNGKQTSKKMPMDPMAMGIQLLSNPKKLKTILAVVSATSLVGAFTIGYFVTMGIISLLEYIF